MDFGCAGGDHGQRHRCAVPHWGWGGGVGGSRNVCVGEGMWAGCPEPPSSSAAGVFEDTVQQPPAFDLSFHSLRVSAAPLAAQLKHISSPKSKPLFKLCPLGIPYLLYQTHL